MHTPQCFLYKINSYYTKAIQIASIVYGIT